MSKEEMRESPQGRSQLSLYSACNRKWAWKYIKGFRVPQQDHSPLHFGSVIHEAQAAMYSTRSKQAAIDTIKKMCPIPSSRALKYEDCMKFKKKVDLSFEKWYTTYGENDLKNNSILMVERELPLTLPNGYKLSVRVDRIIRDPESNEIFINDTKTTGWSLEGTLDKYLMHDQPRLYIAAVNENFPEWTDTLSGWRTDVVYAKAASRSPGGYSIRVQRSEVTNFTDDEIQDVLMTYAGIVDDISGKLQYVGKEPLQSLFPASYGNCDAFNRPCEYRDICPLIDRQTVPPANLETDPWLESGIVLNSFKED